MICEVCLLDDGVEVNMDLEEWVDQFYDPSDEFGYGERSGKVWVCNECGHEVEYEKDIPEYDDD